MRADIQDLILRAAAEDLRMTEAELRVERKERTTRFLARSFGVSEAMASEMYDRVRVERIACRKCRSVLTDNFGSTCQACIDYRTHCTVTGERL